MAGGERKLSLEALLLELIHELLHFLQESHTDVATLNETFLTARHRLFFPSYTLFRQDNTYHSGGVAILVRNSLRAQIVPIPSSPTDSFLVKLSFANSPPLFIATYYCSQSVDFDVNYLHHLATTYTRLLLFGDLNAHHQRFGDRYNTVRGTQVLQAVNNFGLRHHRTCLLYTSRCV